MLAHVLALATAASPGLLVMDFAVEGGASPELATAASSSVAHELDRLGVFRITTSETTRVMLGVERQKQLLGCEDCGALSFADLGLDAELLVTGKVLKTGNQLTLVLTLLKNGASEAAASQRVTGDTPGALLTATGPAAVNLLAKELEGLQGSLLVTASEVGAGVKVDDVLVGTTPLQGPLALAPGPHLVSVEKDGFTAARREVKVTMGEMTEAFFRPVPSPDTIAAYESRAGRTRILAWTAVGVAAVGGGVYLLGQAEADGEYGSPGTQGTFLWYQGKLLQQVESENGVDYRLEATKKKNAVETWQAVSIASLGVAAAAAAAGIVLFVVGDPPDKYDNLKAPPAQVTLAPSANGVVLSGSFW